MRATRSPTSALVAQAEPVHDLRAWLRQIGCEHYYDSFVANDITAALLPELRKSDLREVVWRVGDRLRIYQAIINLRSTREERIPSNQRSSQWPTTSVGPITAASVPLSAATVVTTPPVQDSVNLNFPDNSTVVLSLANIVNGSQLRRAAVREVPFAAPDADSRHFEIHDGFNYYNDDELWKAVKSGSLKNLWVVSSRDSGKVIDSASRSNQRDENSSGSQLADSAKRFIESQFEPSEAQLYVSQENDRPPSEKVAANLPKFFPEAQPDVLKETVRKSRVFLKRLSTLRDPNARLSRRISYVASETDEVPHEKLTRRLSSLNLFNHKNTNLLPMAEDEDFLHELSQEEMSPSNWIKGKMIGAGSFGSVYMAMNQFNGEIMAVKQVELSPQDNNTHQQKMVGVLRHEIDMMRQLSHENIVQYRGFKQEGEFLNIFLEYVSGGSLTSMLIQMGKFGEQIVKHYIRQVLAGLEYLHSRNIVHRDIKGSNILVNDKGVIKISDFGLSKQVEPKNIQYRHSMQGSVFWMAPEVVRQRGATSKADIWSLGCLIIELISGHHPFPQMSQMQAIFKIGQGIPPEIPDYISRELQDFLKHALDPNETNRPNATQLKKHTFLTS